MYVSQPCVVGRKGVTRARMVSLDEEEEAQVEASVDVMRATLESCGFKEWLKFVFLECKMLIGSFAFS
jgi:malate/lactate dehydrogenase